MAAPCQPVAAGHVQAALFALLVQEWQQPAWFVLQEGMLLGGADPTTLCLCSSSSSAFEGFRGLLFPYCVIQAKKFLGKRVSGGWL